MYQGVKFNNFTRNQNFSFDNDLSALNHWAYLFSQLGLAPVHSAGAYGNFSYKVQDNTFIITKSGMIPSETLVAENYCQVINVDTAQNSVTYDGMSPPSSECLLHHLIYQKQAGVHAVLHGHCSLLNTHAQSLNIPVTGKCYPYGTAELAQSALEMIELNTCFFILKDHGFVAIAENIETAGKLTLSFFQRLIELLKGKQVPS